MLVMRRICVPVGLGCNLNCKYCYRDLEKLEEFPDFTPDMIHYLNNLDNFWCEAVIASGGEPLLYWDKVLELFSYVPSNVHKLILTNGLLLDEDKVNYINENNIGVSLSHDGRMTEFLRGQDPLNDEKLLNLIRRIKILRIFAVVTSYNNDVWDNFFYTISKLGRTDIYYDTNTMGDNNIPEQQYLIKDFDYNLFIRTLFEFRYSSYYKVNPYRQGRSLMNNPLKGVRLRGGFDVLPNGIVCGLTHINSNYGTIYTETYNELNDNLNKTGQRDKCKLCEINNICEQNIQYLSDHFCRVRKERREFVKNDELVKAAIYNATEGLSDIENRYGYVRK